MIACYAWSNLQILNVTNAVANIYSNEQADLFVRMGPHLSESLIAALENSGIYRHVHCIDPLKIDVSKERGGRIPRFRIFALKRAYQNAYDALIGQLCGETVYGRVLVPWFFADSVFFLRYWAKNSPNLRISFVEEGTSSYYYTKGQMCFPMFNVGNLRAKVKRHILEGPLMRKFSKHVDSICMYKPEYCQEDIDFKKEVLPLICQDTNPKMYRVLKAASAGLSYRHFMRYEKKDVIYFSSYNVNNPEFEQQCGQFLQTVVNKDFPGNIICKVHTHASTHAETFASELEDQIFVDREKYIFESLYMQLPRQSERTLISCVSTTAFTPKFMFGEEPTIIFTYRLYNDYRQHPVESDDRLAEILRSSYTDKNKVLIPNSTHDLARMIRNIHHNKA